MDRKTITLTSEQCALLLQYISNAVDSCADKAHNWAHDSPLLRTGYILEARALESLFDDIYKQVKP